MPRLVLLALEVESSPEALPLGAASVAAALGAAFRTAATSGAPVNDAAGDAAALTGRGLELSLVDGLVSEAAQARRLVLAQKPDMLGLSVYSWNRAAMTDAARLCREALPGLLVFAGGPEATADAARLLAEAGLDFVVRGEGESASVAALGAIVEAGSFDAARARLAGMPGILVRGAPPVSRTEAANAQRSPTEDLSRLPSPWLTGFLKPKEGGALWELARGCPYRCAYCYEGKGERGLRRFDRARIEAELDHFVSAGVRQVFVLDPTFDADRAGAKSLLELFAKRGGGIHFKFEIRAELLDRSLAERFASISCSLQVGLQSADPEVSEACGRPLDLKAFERGIRHLNATGAVFGLDLIYGLPKDNLSGFRRSLDFALGLQPNHLDVFPLALLPGTELAERAAEWGIVAEAQAPYLVRSLPGFPAADLGKAARLARACDLFYCRGRAVAWFLQVLRPLGLKPSTLLTRFADWLEGSHPALPDPRAGSREVEGLQLDFLEVAYRDKGHEKLLPAVRDLVRFNAAWARALAEGEESRLELTYDPDEVLGPAALDLASFARMARPRPGRWLLKPGKNGPRLEREGRSRR